MVQKEIIMKKIGFCAAASVVLLVFVFMAGIGFAQNNMSNQETDTVIYSSSLLDQIVEIGNVDRFLPGKYIIIDDILIRIPPNVPLFNDRGKKLEAILPGSIAGIARDPETNKITAIIKLSKNTFNELVKKREGK